MNGPSTPTVFLGLRLPSIPCYFDAAAAPDNRCKRRRWRRLTAGRLRRGQPPSSISGTPTPLAGSERTIPAATLCGMIVELAFFGSDELECQSDGVHAVSRRRAAAWQREADRSERRFTRRRHAEPTIALLYVPYSVQRGKSRWGMAALRRIPSSGGILNGAVRGRRRASKPGKRRHQQRRTGHDRVGRCGQPFQKKATGPERVMESSKIGRLVEII
jgi:hypothetical protein